jgi:S1-C subfamily serine protease
VGFLHEDADDNLPLAPILPTDSVNQLAMPGEEPQKEYGADGPRDGAGVAGLPAPPGAGAGQAIPDWAQPPVQVVLAPGQVLPRRPRTGLLVLLALVAIVVGSACGALVASLTTSTSPETVVEVVAPSGSGPVIGDPSAILGKVLPAVVSIDAGVAPAGIASGDFGGGAGTGMIITPGGLVLTNANVVAGTSSVTVTLYDHSAPLQAKVVGTDEAGDIALLQLEGGTGPYPTVSLGDSSAVAQGDSVLAVGNALVLTGGPTVTEGIVSAVGRSWTNQNASGQVVGRLSGLIQTDAPISAGSSGGPLVDAQGQVIGMLTAIDQSPPGNAPAQDIDFAIAADTIKPVIASLEPSSHS